MEASYLNGILDAVALVPEWLGIAWILAWVASSLLYRRVKGKPIFAEPPLPTDFLERWRSGRLPSSLLGRIGGASNCLMVAVGGGRVRIRPHFPFTLMFLPEIYGLEVDLPLAKVTGVRRERGLLGEWVLVELKDHGTSRTFELHLRDPGAFLRALGLAG